MDYNQISVDDFINIGFFGIMLFVLLYALGVYVYDKKSIFLYYSLYIFSLGVYLFSRSELVYEHIISEMEIYFPRINYFISYTFQYVAHFAALQFGVLFLNAKKDYHLFYRAAYYVRIFFLIAILLSVINISFFNNQVFNTWWSNIERAIATIATVYMQLAILFQSKNKLVVFYVVGSMLFLIGAVVSVFFFDVIYMRIGTLIEILLFALGLAYRSQLLQKERNLFREKMLAEINEKEKLLQTYNEDLQQQVLLRSEALLEEQKAVEAEKQKVLRLSLEKEVDQMKMTALRAQMKPHFLFNALNAIRAMIIKDNPHQAYDYLTDFAHLVRYILESSEHTYVSLSEELKMIGIYVHIEKIRASGNFKFSTKVSEDVLDLKVPPLIFQPFLENAIIHGFDYSRKDYLLNLEIKRETDCLKIIVTDNGIGRKNAQRNTRNSSFAKTKSMAMKLTKQRLKLLDSDKAQIEIIDLKDQDNKAAGTKVVMNLPIVTNEKEVKSIIS